MATLNYSTYDRLALQTSTSINADDAVTDPNVQALADALDAVIRGSAIKAVKSIRTTVDAGSAVPPADVEANRKNKWLFRTQVSAEDGKIYTNELGTADNTALPSPATDFLDLTAGLGLALKTAWETVYESPQGNAGVLISVQQVNEQGN